MITSSAYHLKSFLQSFYFFYDDTYDRLPVGHTHEDIDGVFGSLATWFWDKRIMHPFEYKGMVEKSFGPDSGSSMSLLVEDIWVVPDYTSFFHSSIDGKLSLLHKGENTQHQWRFEAVVISKYFPTGAKAMYRKYCSDKVVIMERRCKLRCLSKVGKITGTTDGLLL